MLSIVKAKALEISTRIVVWCIKFQFAFKPISYEMLSGERVVLFLQNVTWRQDPDGRRFFLKCRRGNAPGEPEEVLPRIYVLDYQKIQFRDGRHVYDRKRPEDHHHKLKPQPQKRVSLSGAPESLRRQFGRTLDADPRGREPRDK